MNSDLNPKPTNTSTAEHDAYCAREVVGEKCCNNRQNMNADV